MHPLVNNELAILLLLLFLLLFLLQADGVSSSLTLFRLGDFLAEENNDNNLFAFLSFFLSFAEKVSAENGRPI